MFLLLIEQNICVVGSVSSGLGRMNNPIADRSDNDDVEQPEPPVLRNTLKKKVRTV
jgi:hypothetical protein